jgi:hypothetical protein
MEGRFSELLLFCSQIDFGPITFSREEEKFRKELNRELLSLCEYLPQSMQTKAVLFLMKYMNTSLSGGLNFVNYFHPPAWTILHWLQHSCPDKKKLSPKKMREAKTGHTMAMFLHALDDHLSDGQLPVTHLALLMRSYSWMIMNQAFEKLSREVKDGKVIVSDFINNYYSSIDSSNQADSLDSYCEIFKKQMATWLIVPVLLAKRMDGTEELTHSVQTVYSSFGLAWRLLDDLQDIEQDLKKGAHSSLYACLPNTIRKKWDWAKDENENINGKSVAQVLNYILKTEVIERIRERICSELESAASLANTCNLTGFADELRCLMQPLKKG